jgi:hypothetical protein
MDPAQLLAVPLVSNPALSKMMEAAQTRGIVWGHEVEYKSCYLDTLPDNKKPVLRSAPWPATKRFNPSDNRDQNAKYDDAALGTKPMSLPYARVVSTGLREPGMFPSKPHQKESIDGSHVVAKPYMLKEPRNVLSLTTNDIEGAESKPKLGPARQNPTSPLTPSYQVASWTMAPVPPPKFLRDSIQCDDISGNTRLKLFGTPRESATMYCDDISGTRTRFRVRTRNAPYNAGEGVPALPLSLDTLEGADISDEVNRLPFKFIRTARNVNPLTPEYRYNVPSNDPLQGPMLGHRLSGERPGKVPKEVSDGWTLPQPDKVRVKRFATGAKFLNWPGPQNVETPGPTRLPGDVTYREYMLRSDDVVGAQSGTKGRFLSRTTPFYRTQEGISNYSADIDKSQPAGPFTLLPAHILTRRLAESAQSGSVTARPTMAGSTDPQSKIAWGDMKPSVHADTTSKVAASASSPKNNSDLHASAPQGLQPRLSPASMQQQQTSRISSTAGTPRARATPRSAGTPRSSGPRAAALDPKLLAALSTS